MLFHHKGVQIVLLEPLPQQIVAMLLLKVIIFSYAFIFGFILITIENLRGGHQRQSFRGFGWKRVEKAVLRVGFQCLAGWFL